LKNKVLFVTIFGVIFFLWPTISHHLHSSRAIAEDTVPDIYSDKTVMGYLTKADRYYKQGKYHEAISFWDRVLDIEPNNLKAVEGIKDAEKKMSKINDFFGSSTFQDFNMAKEFSIEDCMDIASQNSIPLEVARHQIKLSYMKVWEARRAFFPSLTLSWTKTSGIQSGGKTEGVEYGIEGKQPAFHSGGIMYVLAQAKADMSIAESNYDKVRTELYFEVAKAYYILARAKKQLDYTQDIYDEMIPYHEMAKKAYEKAVTPSIEFLNVESNFNQLYYQAVSNKNEFDMAKLNLEQKLSMEDAEGVDITVDEEPGNITKDMNACLELALENRPDLKIGLYTVKYTEYGKKIADTKEMPSIDLVGNYKKASEVYRESFSILNEPQKLDPHKKWYVGLEASMPFLGSTASYSYFRRHDPPSLSTFQPDSEQRGTTLKLDILNNLKNLTEIEQAKIANIKAEQDLEDARKKAIMEVKEAYYGYERSRIQLAAAKSQKEFREKEFKILKYKNSMGENELSELFDNVTKLLGADALYCEAEANLNVSIAALNKAIGIENYF